MTTDQTTIPGSDADYWINTVDRARTARRTLSCACSTCPVNGIKKGMRYLDTGERGAGGPWATYKSCEKHANDPIGNLQGA